ncbi:MAG: NADPH:quinone reductase [bacterium]|jgi:NADPH2:quinone reductase|nr:NADPH:quinone reductase [bacterium]
MKAAIYRTHGAARDVLRVEDLPDPHPGPGEVRVRIRVSGVNPTDWKSRQGGRPIEADFQIPNQDGAGEIDEVGEGVDGARLGERVWVYNAAYRRAWGTAAECSVVPARQAVRLPDHVGFEVGASLGIPAITAHRALFADGPVDGRTVLVAGGAGAVGHHALALGRRAGGRMLATVSSEAKAALAGRAGADHVVNYREPGAAQAIRERAPGGVDRVVELAPVANSELDEQVLAGSGTIAIYANDAAEWPIVPRELMARNRVLRFILVYEMPEAAKEQAVRDITAALEARDLPPMDFVRYPLADTAQAHEAVEQGAVGKVLIEVA